MKDSKGCTADAKITVEAPAWCLLSNASSSSSSSRDYWTLPDGMLPWLLAVCALVAVFVLGTIVACIVWSCVSEHNPAEPKLKTLEESGTSSARKALITEDARSTTRVEAEAEAETETEAEAEVVEEPVKPKKTKTSKGSSGDGSAQSKKRHSKKKRHSAEHDDDLGDVDMDEAA